MGKRRWHVLVPFLPLLIGSWLLMAFLHPDMGVKLTYIGSIVVCILLVQTTIASAWVALGPLPFLWRLPLSIGWVVCLSAAVATNMARVTTTPWEKAFLLFGMLAGGHWMFAQVPFWLLASRYSLALDHFTRHAVTACKSQFGIRQVLILTTIVATVLALGRAAVLLLDIAPDDRAVFPVQIGCFVIAHVTLLFPLILSPLLPRHAIVCTLLTCTMIYFFSWAQGLIFARFGMGISFSELLVSNYWQGSWAIAISGTLRIFGYVLFAPTRRLL